jgi:glycosyltransferase involved in cell wall biosynthesis
MTSSPLQKGRPLRPDPTPTILYLVAEDWWFVLHRMHIAQAARRSGFRVIVASDVDRHGSAIAGGDLELIPISWNRRSVNPLRILGQVVATARIYREVRPDLIHHLAIKPSVLGSVAAWLSRSRPVINNLAGLGSVFAEGGTWRTRVLRRILLISFRLTFSGPHTVTIVENADDLELLVAEAGVPPDRVALIPSIGVDLEEFVPREEPEGIPIVRMVARMLKPKGVEYFVEAARILRAREVVVRMQLVGAPDEGNPDSVSVEDIEAWVSEGSVDWLGWRTDMPIVWAESTIAVLPTYYREGIPVSLLEASATGRPLVATDVPGCRDVVDHGVTGLLVEPRDPVGLADAIEELLRDPERRREMGLQGRRRVETQFSRSDVQSATLELYDRMLESVESARRLSE